MDVEAHRLLLSELGHQQAITTFLCADPTGHARGSTALPIGSCGKHASKAMRAAASFRRYDASGQARDESAARPVATAGAANSPTLIQPRLAARVLAKIDPKHKNPHRCVPLSSSSQEKPISPKQGWNRTFLRRSSLPVGKTGRMSPNICWWRWKSSTRLSGTRQCHAGQPIDERLSGNRRPQATSLSWTDRPKRGTGPAHGHSSVDRPFRPAFLVVGAAAGLGLKSEQIIVQPVVILLFAMADPHPGLPQLRGHLSAQPCFGRVAAPSCSVWGSSVTGYSSCGFVITDKVCIASRHAAAASRPLL